MNVRGVDFVVYHVPDMRRAKAFYAKGVEVQLEPWETRDKAYVADPFGNPICLHQRKNGTAG